MYYDLNVPYSPGDPEISATLSFLAERMPHFLPFFFPGHARGHTTSGRFSG